MKFAILVCTTTFPSSLLKSSIGKLIKSSSSFPSSKGKTLSTGLPPFCSVCVIPSRIIIPVSLNCRATEFGKPRDHQCFHNIALMLDAVLLVLLVTVLIRRAVPAGPYHSYMTSSKFSPSNCPDHFKIALSTTSLGRLYCFALLSANSSAGFIFRSAHFFAAIWMILPILA